MARLGAAIAEVVIAHEGTGGFLRRLSDPFWFQSFGAVLGMDWHSSGITTSVMGALKRGLGPQSRELGLTICGGRGKAARRTPQELLDVAERTGLNGDVLVKYSRLVAKVDNTAIQDGYSIYLHTFIVDNQGDWVVVQQGMNELARDARRYHWRSQNITSFVEEPHDAIIGPNRGRIINLTDRRAEQAREATVHIASEDPGKTVVELQRLATSRHLSMPEHHDIRLSDVFLRRLHGVLALANETGVAEFEDLLLTKGLGPRTLQALALVSEVAFGAPSRFDDPARFAFAHGGKDGHPHPVPLSVYDKTINTLKRALDQARIDNTQKIEAFRRLDAQARKLECIANGPSFHDIVQQEWASAPLYGGRTVFGPTARSRSRQKPADANDPPTQLKLFA